MFTAAVGVASAVVSLLLVSLLPLAVLPRASVIASVAVTVPSARLDRLTEVAVAFAVTVMVPEVKVTTPEASLSRPVTLKLTAEASLALM